MKKSGLILAIVPAGRGVNQTYPVPIIDMMFTQEIREYDCPLIKVGAKYYWPKKEEWLSL